MGGPDAYLIWLVAAAACGLAFFMLYRPGTLMAPSRRLAAGLLAVLLGVLGARLFYFFARLQYLVPMYGWGHVTDLAPQGLAFGGAVLGVLGAGWLTSRLTRVPADPLLDRLVPAALLTLALARAGEYTVHIGEGPYVQNAALQFFPLAIRNEWGEWYFAIFVLEALCALAVLLWMLGRRGWPAGRAWRRALLYLLLTQVLCESLRAESLRWGFVRVHQLFAVLVAFVLLLEKLRRRGARPWLRIGLFLLGTAVLIGIEFALDKWPAAPHWALYLVMAATLAGMGAAVVGSRKAAGRG